MKLSNSLVPVILLLSALMLLGSGPAQPDRPEQKPITSSTLLDGRPAPPRSALSPDDLCDGEWMGPVDAAVLWYYGQEYYAVYQDPEETGCTNTYPFEVTTVYWDLFNEGGGAGDLTINVQPVIYSVDLSNPACPKPGVVIARGDVVPVFVGDGELVTVELPISPTSIRCVTGPYFAGVHCPDYIGWNTLSVVIDNPAASLFGLRTCATYNCYRGYWEDLVTIPQTAFTENIRLWSEGHNSSQNSCTDCPTAIEAGYDLWQTARDGEVFDEDFFLTDPLPADFFGPGSDPFDGQIALEGQPLETSPAGVLGQTDVIIRRPNAEYGGPVEIEMVALSLVSSAPVTVTYDGGQNPESWDVKVCLSETPYPDQGLVYQYDWCCDGGDYQMAFGDDRLRFYPKFIFIRQSDQTERVLDFADWGLSVEFWTDEGRWSTALHPPDIPGLVISPGEVDIDHDCDAGTPDVVIGQSSRLLWTGGYGAPWFPEPCEEQYCPATSSDQYEHIFRVQVGSIDNISEGDGYIDYYATQSTTMVIGQAHPFTITASQPISTLDWGIWVDWNNDYDFYDLHEEIVTLQNSGGPITGGIVVPLGTPVGSCRMRIRTVMSSSFYQPEPCGYMFRGETEDYRIDVEQALCEAEGQCEEQKGFIAMVEEPSQGFNLVVFCDDDYFDAFGGDPLLLSPTLPTIVYVLNGNPEALDSKCHAWVDWTADNDFNDDGESFLGLSGPATFTVYVAAPEGTPPGDYRMRIRIDEEEAGPCGESSSGNVVDLRVTKTGCCVDRVGDANNSGDDEPTIGDITAMIDAKFITGKCDGVIDCIAEADVNLSGTLVNPPLDCDDITIGDITKVIDYMFITGKDHWEEGYGQGNLPPCP